MLKVGHLLLVYILESHVYLIQNIFKSLNVKKKVHVPKFELLQIRRKTGFSFCGKNVIKQKSKQVIDLNLYLGNVYKNRGKNPRNWYIFVRTFDSIRY